MYYPSGTFVQNATTRTVALTTVNQSGTFTVRGRNAVDEGPASNAASYNVGNGSSSGTCSA